MSVLAYTGLPGSGKSYGVVDQQVLPALRQGLTVVTNLPLKLDLIRQDFEGADIRDFPLDAIRAEPDRIFEFCPNGSVVIVDELWKLFPSGAKANQVPDAFKTFLAEHRHRVDAAGRSQQIVFVCQDLAQISAFARQLVETTFRSVKLTAVGQKSRFRVDVYNGPMSGPNPPVAQRLREMFYRYKPEVFRYYTSHTLSESGSEGADERAVDRRANVLLRPMVLMAPVVVVVLVWFGFHQLGRSHAGLFKGSGAAQRSGSGAPRPGAHNQPVAVVPPAGSALKLSAPSWRVSMVVRGALGGFAVLEDGTHAVWLELNRCRVSHFDVACPYGGKYWDSSGIPSPERQGPL